jgi:hypothetical protein
MRASSATAWYGRRWESQSVQRQTPNGSVVPPTGKKMNAHGCDVYKWEGGQITVDRIYRDRLETLIQRGLSPDPAAARA